MQPGSNTLRALGGAALVGLLAGLGTAPAPACALPVLSEVFYDAEGPDNGLVFVELFGEPGRALDGFVLEGVNGADGGVYVRLELAGTIPPDRLFVVADDRGDGLSDVPGADLVTNFDLQNGPDSVVLRSEGVAVDALGYGSFGPTEVFAGEGSPAVDAPAGSSLARRFADLDANDNALDFVALDSPTPGSAPLSSIPEPATGAQLLLGIAGLAWAGRRPLGRPARR